MTYTPEQRREIDALVAEHVMGWIRPQTTAYEAAAEAEPMLRQFIGYWWHPDEKELNSQLPEFTADAAADYRVLSLVRETWGDAQAVEFLNNLPNGQFGYKPGDYAIAALRAKGVTLPEEE